MAKTKKPAKKKAGGPFLAAALFCHDILEDTNRMLSVAGIVDGVQVLVPPNAPSDMPSKENPVQFISNILVIIKSGDSPGKHQLRFVGEQPDGQRTELHSQEIELTQEPSGGANIKSKATLKLFNQGVFWIDVILDGKRLTRMPLNVSIQRQEMPLLPHAGT